MPDNNQEWQDLLKDNLKDKALQRVHKKLLDSSSLCKETFRLDEYSVKDIKTIYKQAGLKLLVCKVINKVKKGDSKIDAWYLRPNDLTQREALKDAYKLKGKYEPEAHTIDISNISDEEIESKIQDIIKEIRGASDGERS